MRNYQQILKHIEYLQKCEKEQKYKTKETETWITALKWVLEK
jgi:hypothetical protein